MSIPHSIPTLTVLDLKLKYAVEFCLHILGPSQNHLLVVRVTLRDDGQGIGSTSFYAKLDGAGLKNCCSGGPKSKSEQHNR